MEILLCIERDADWLENIGAVGQARVLYGVACFTVLDSSFYPHVNLKLLCLAATDAIVAQGWKTLPQWFRQVGRFVEKRVYARLRYIRLAWLVPLYLWGTCPKRENASKYRCTLLRLKKRAVYVGAGYNKAIGQVLHNVFTAQGQISDAIFEVKVIV